MQYRYLERPRRILIVVGSILLVLLVIWGIYLARPRPPVDFQVLGGDIGAYNDQSWDHIEAVVVPRKTDRDDLQKLLLYFRTKFVDSKYGRVRVLIFNNRFALTNADESALVAEYDQDREKGKFDMQIY